MEDAMEQTGMIPIEQKFPLEIICLDGEALFNAHDVAAGLQLSDSARDMALSRMKPTRKVVVSNDMLQASARLTNCEVRKIANRGETFLRESGLYQLAMSSRSAGAERFKDWVFEEVLPSIRKTGQYSIAPRPQVPALPQNYEEALEHLLVAVKQKRLAEERLALQEPKVEAYERFLGCHAEISMGEAAKVIDFPGVGPVKLYIFLREHNVLMSSPGRWNLPYQDYMDRGWFKVKVNTYRKNGHDETCDYRKTVVTPKGLVGIYRLLKKHLGEQEVLL